MRLINFAIISGLLINDQITKWLARNFLSNPIEMIPNIFWLKHTQNQGIAFSIPFPRTILIIFTILVIILISYFLYTKKTNNLEKFAISLVLSGAIGNLIDRIFIGTVTDFLAFWTFPIFNLADTWITCGISIFILNEFLNTKKSE